MAKAKRDPNVKAVGRPRKYKTEAALRRMINLYFMSISTRRPVVIDELAVVDDDGEPVLQTIWIRPPTVAGLCRFLGIDRSTWANYCDKEMYPEYQDATRAARIIMEEYLEEELLTRDKPNGVIFNLRANYGWNDKAADQTDNAIHVVLEGAGEGWAE